MHFQKILFSDMDDIDNFIALVARMRQAQKEYYAWKGDAFTKSQKLSEARMLEMRVDGEIAKVMTVTPLFG